MQTFYLGEEEIETLLLSIKVINSLKKLQSKGVNIPKFKMLTNYFECDQLIDLFVDLFNNIKDLKVRSGQYIIDELSEKDKKYLEKYIYLECFTEEYSNFLYYVEIKGKYIKRLAMKKDETLPIEIRNNMRNFFNACCGSSYYNDYVVQEVFLTDENTLRYYFNDSINFPDIFIPFFTLYESCRREFGNENRKN